MTEYEHKSLQLLATITRGLQLIMVQAGVYSDRTAGPEAHREICGLVNEWHLDSSKVLADLAPTIPVPDPPPFSVFPAPDEPA